MRFLSRSLFGLKNVREIGFSERLQRQLRYIPSYIISFILTSSSSNLLSFLIIYPHAKRFLWCARKSFQRFFFFGFNPDNQPVLFDKDTGNNTRVVFFATIYRNSTLGATFSGAQWLNVTRFDTDEHTRDRGK